MFYNVEQQHTPFRSAMFCWTKCTISDFEPSAYFQFYAYSHDTARRQSHNAKKRMQLTKRRCVDGWCRFIYLQNNQYTVNHRHCWLHAEQGLWIGRASVVRSRRAAGLLLSAVRAGDIDRQRRPPSNSRATAWDRSTALSSKCEKNNQLYLQQLMSLFSR